MPLAGLRTKGAYGLWHYVPRALPYLRPYRRLLSFSAVLTVLNTLVHLVQPWPLAIMIDSVVGDNPLPPIAEDILPDRRSLRDARHPRRRRLRPHGARQTG